MGILPLLSLWTAYVSCENRTPDRTGNSDWGGSWGQTHCKNKAQRGGKGGSTSETVPPRVPPGVMWGLSSLTCRWCGEKVQQKSRTKNKIVEKRSLSHSRPLSQSSTMWALTVSLTGRQWLGWTHSRGLAPGQTVRILRATATIHVAVWSKDDRNWFSCLANHHTNCLQHVESMHAHWAKISEHVAEIQKALNNSIVLGLNGSFSIYNCI